MSGCISLASNLYLPARPTPVGTVWNSASTSSRMWCLTSSIEEVRPHEADAAVDVVADAAGRDDAALGRVGRRDAADAEAVAPVDVRHRQAGALDAGQHRDVRDLVGGLILADRCSSSLSLAKIRPVHAHPGLVALGNADAVRIDPFEGAAIGLLLHGELSAIR